MKVLIMRPSFNPEMSAGNHLALDLILDLKKAGHDVILISPVSEKYMGLPADYQDPCIVYRVKSKIKGKSIIKRIIRYVNTSFLMYKCAKNLDYDVILSHSMPPLLGPFSCILGKKKNKNVIYWEQDIVSNSIITTGLGVNNSLKQ